jgi:hypothetical protein
MAYTSGSIVTVTASAPTFSPSDVGAQLVLLTESGDRYRLTFTQSNTPTSMLAEVKRDLPDELQDTPTTLWERAVLVISGLSHLEGAEVSILADGSVHPTRTVASGRITLQAAASVVLVGLAYAGEIETLDVTIPGSGIEGNRKAVHSAVVHLLQTRGLQLSSGNELVEIPERTSETYGVPTEPFTGKREVNLGAKWSRGGSVRMVQSYPLPATVLGVTGNVSIGG